MAEPINTQLGSDLITGDLSLSPDSDNYFYYTITEDQSTTSTYNVMTLFNSETNSTLNIRCILDSSDSLSNSIKDKLSTSNICKVFQSTKIEIINVLFDITGYKKDKNLKLWLNIKTSSKQSAKVKAYIRKKGSDLSDFKDQKEKFSISEPYAFKVGIREFGHEITTQNYFEALYQDAIHIYGEKKDGTIELIDYTSIFPITDQTLAAHLHRYQTVYFFFGTNSASEKTLDVNFKSLDKKKYPMYYHTNVNGQLEQTEISFFSECNKNDAFYFLINSRDDNEPYLFINNLEGGDLYSKDGVFEVDGEYSIVDINAATKRDTNEYHFDILKLKCGNLGQINANIRYKNKELLEDYIPMEGEFTDFFIEHKAGASYKVIMVENINSFRIKVFAPESKVSKKFTITFESTDYEIESGRALYLTRKSSQTASFRVKPSVNENINYILSVSSFTNLGNNEGIMKVGDKEVMYIYTLVQKLNAGYGVEITLQNTSPTPRAICYYAGEITTLQFSSQNCKMVSGQAAINITKVLYKREEELDELHDVKTYYIHLFNKDTGEKIDFYKTRILTDLEKSKQINVLENDLYTLQDKIEKNKDYYYSHNFKNGVGIGSPEGHFDLYLIDDTYDNVNLELQCILETEIAIEYIKDSFTPENNKCILLNGQEKNKNVLHILFEQEGYLKNPDADIIIKVKSNKDTTIKFIDRKDMLNNVLNTLDLYKDKNTIKLTNEESSTIYSFNLTYLHDLVATSVILFNKYPDSIKIFGKINKNNYELVDKGSLLVISNYDYKAKYSNMEKFYLVVGQYQINPVRSDFYLLTRHNSYVSYYTLPNGLIDGYTIQIKNQDCNKDNTKYVILNYAKPSNKETYLSNRHSGGTLIEPQYQDVFSANSYEDSMKTLKEFQNITDNQQHSSLIKFKCEDNLNMRVTYFYKNAITSNTTAIKLVAGEAKQFFLGVGKIYTFDYTGINEIKIDYLYGESDKRITFEGSKAYPSEENVYLLYRKKNDKNSFTIENTSKRLYMVVRISTSYDITKYKTSAIKNLFLNGNKYI